MNRTLTAVADVLFLLAMLVFGFAAGFRYSDQTIDSRGGMSAERVERAMDWRER